MIVTTVVRENAWSSHPTWSAFVVLDGDWTSWDCTHLHLSPEVAERCLVKLQRDADRRLHADGATVEAVDNERNLWELTVGAWTKRFRRFP